MKICPQCGSASDDQIEVCPVDHSILLSIDPNADPMLGKLLDEKYRLVRKIGEGGMGSIYRAVHTEMLRTCAIKLLTAPSPGKDEAIARFKREAKMASHIDNIHAVTIYDFGQTEDGMLFLAMEFIDGNPLSRVIAEERVLTIDRVVHITNQVAEALAAAHALGIVHRDLKPDNVMITRKGADADFVKVLDFGIAKAVADDEGENLTKTGFVLGTPVYMSPEQLLGEKLDRRSDIYSLAIIVYEMLSGRLPFEGDNPQAVMMKRVMSEPIRLGAVAPFISESVERAVMAGLARNREARTADVEIFTSELSRALHSGTQQMGAVVTSRLVEPGAARETRELTGVMTSASGSQAATPSAHVWAPTEVSQAVVQPHVIEQTAPPPSATDRDQLSNSRDAQIDTKRSPRANKLVWAGSMLGILAIAAVLYVAFASGSASFTLVVKGAPSGSQIFVNGSRRDAVPVNVGLKVVGLEPGPAHVRVSHEGYADFMTTITGVKGEVQSCEAQLLPEIDYHGPMLPIPQGEFEMGSDKFEADERPAHRVSLPAYYIDKYEVTNAQYKQFCDETHRKYPPNPSFEPDYFIAKPQYPALGVTFEDALAYASWAGKRLPTEEEWEKAASWDPIARRKRLYPWGDEPVERADIGTGKPAPVAEANGDRSPYGVFDMGGNALEWVDASYRPYEGGEKSDPAYQKDERVVRGASFLQTLDKARTSYRDHLPRIFPEGKSTPVGLRCAISANDPRIQSLVHERNK